ncbi:hypothetical protein A2U01_0102470, partial [Trifolium medium]|nr:hypothetical protein [Trifolium medium]
MWAQQQAAYKTQSRHKQVTTQITSMDLLNRELNPIFFTPGASSTQ